MGIITIKLRWLATIIVALLAHSAVAEELFSSAEYPFKVDTVVSGLDHPWSLEFLPDGRMLVSERSGQLRIIENGQLLETPIAGVPEVRVGGQGGLLDIALDPDYKNNQLIYLSYSGVDEQGVSTDVARAKLVNNQLQDLTVIFKLLPKSKTKRHFGSRLLFDEDGTLFISLGDQTEQNWAQDLSNHAGTLVRINPDGSIPDDNPFVNQTGAKPEIYTYGNRNMQGLAKHPVTGAIWSVEHGPQGGDELNLMRAGVNYGWPVITYGKNYFSGTKIGEGTEKAGMEQPVHYWVPSIATSSLLFYDGDAFPNWRSNAFVSSLLYGQIARLVIEDNKVVHEERLINGAFGRLREVKQGPDGFLYLLTDFPSPRGKLLRLRPVQ